jgi:glycosyltransferase involved in cell wall biosynthesis
MPSQGAFLRVALVVTDLQRGGTPLRLARLARGLRSAGQEVHVGCLAAPGPVGADLERDGIPTFSCGAISARNWGAIVRLRGHMRRIRPDLIHSTLTHANVACRLVGRSLGIPVVSSTATIEVERRGHLRLERWTARLDRGQIVSSAALAQHVRTSFRVPAERIHVVPPFVDPWPTRVDRAAARRSLDLPPDAFVVLWAGRFDPVKRLDLLLDAAARLPAADWRFVLAGDGPLRSTIESRVAREPMLAQRVQLTGWLDDLSPALCAADVFAFPSLTEGTPNAVLAAMAAGLPVVGSAIPALHELSGAEERIMLVQDGADAWAQALAQMRSDDRLRKGFADRASTWAAANLSAARTVAATIEVYERVVRRKSSAASDA